MDKQRQSENVVGESRKASASLGGVDSGLIGLPRGRWVGNHRFVRYEERCSIGYGRAICFANKMQRLLYCVRAGMVSLARRGLRVVGTDSGAVGGHVALVNLLLADKGLIKANSGTGFARTGVGSGFCPYQGGEHGFPLISAGGVLFRGKDSDVR